MTEPTDFKRIISELEYHGITLYKIALMMTEAGLKTQYTQVKRWSEGSEPRDSQATMLRALHSEHVPRETLQA